MKGLPGKTFIVYYVGCLCHRPNKNEERSVLGQVYRYHAGARKSEAGGRYSVQYQGTRG